MTRYCMHCMESIDEQDVLCPHCGKEPHCEVEEHYILPGTILNHK